MPPNPEFMAPRPRGTSRPALKRTRNHLRCVCAQTPLLAMYGMNEKNQLYVHMKVFKGDRIFGEMVINPAPGSTLELHCRVCLRWLTVRVKPETVVPTLEVTDEPSVIGADNGTS